VRSSCEQRGGQLSDPARPKQAFGGNQAVLSASDAARNRGQRSVETRKKSAELDVNRPDAAGDQGRKPNLYA